MFGSVRARVGSLAWDRAIPIAIIAALSWPVVYAPARIGVDPSWEAALHLAFADGIQYGSSLAFTYGPLGFLAWAWPWFGPENVLSMLFIGVLWVSVTAAIYLGARRVLPTWLAVVVTYITARAVMVLEPFDTLLILAFAGCAAVLLRREDRPPAWLVAAGGVVIGVALLGKLDAAVFIAAMIGTTVLAAYRPRTGGMVILLVSAAATTFGLWLAIGQRAGDFTAYIANALQIISGYSQAMSGGIPELMIPVYLILVVLVAGIATVDARRRPVDQRVGLLVVGGLMAFAFFKIAFVRYNIGYTTSAVLISLLAVASTRLRRPVLLAGLVAALAVSMGTARFGSAVLTSPVGAVRSLAHEAALVARPWRWEAAEQKTRDQLRVRYKLEPAIVDALQGHTVHVDPWETAVMVAWPELRWRPVPVFQSYSAYTPALDQLNADSLRGPSAPERILRSIDVPESGGSAPTVVAIEQRNGWFDAPAAMLETLCRYDEIVATPHWEVLARTGRRCGSPEPLATVVAMPGSPVEVPTESRADRFVVVRIHGIEDTLAARLVTALYKSPPWSITLDGGSPYRLVPGTAVDGLVMAVPAAMQRTGGAAFGPAIRTVAVDVHGAFPAPGPLTYEFVSVPLLGQ